MKFRLKIKVGVEMEPTDFAAMLRTIAGDIDASKPTFASSGHVHDEDGDEIGTWEWVLSVD